MINMGIVLNAMASVVLVAQAVFVLARLPGRIALHWGLDGLPNSHGSSIILIIIAAIPILFWAGIELLAQNVTGSAAAILSDVRLINAVVAFLMVGALAFAILKNLGVAIPPGTIAIGAAIATLTIVGLVAYSVVNRSL